MKKIYIPFVSYVSVLVMYSICKLYVLCINFQTPDR